MRSPGRGSRGKLRRPSYYPDPARSHRQLRLWLRIEWGIQAAYSEAKEEKCLGWSAPPRVSLLYTWCSDTQGVASVLDSSLEVASPQPPLPNTVLRGHLDMATFDALERLQKFDWLIQKLHNIRSTLQSDQGLQELQKLHALQLLQNVGLPPPGRPRTVGAPPPGRRRNAGMQTSGPGSSAPVKNAMFAAVSCCILATLASATASLARMAATC